MIHSPQLGSNGQWITLNDLEHYFKELQCDFYISEENHEVTIEVDHPYPDLIYHAISYVWPACVGLIVRKMALKEPKAQVCLCFGPPTKDCPIHG